MLSRQAILKLRPALGRVAGRSLATKAQAEAGRSSSQQENLAYGAAAFLSLVGAGAGVAMMEGPPSKTKHIGRAPIAIEDPNNPPPRPDLPTISLEEIAEHADEDSLWYTFRGAVYDLTFFINGHPGGTPVSALFASISFRKKTVVKQPYHPKSLSHKQNLLLVTFSPV